MNASNTLSNTQFSTYSFWMVKIHMSLTKSHGSQINLVDSMWILTNQNECVEKCVLECILLEFLKTEALMNIALSNVCSQGCHLHYNDNFNLKYATLFYFN